MEVKGLSILDENYNAVLPSLKHAYQTFQPHMNILIKECLDEWWIDLLRFEPFKDKKEVVMQMGGDHPSKLFQLTYRLISNEFKDWGDGGYYRAACDQILTFSQSLFQLNLQLKEVEQKGKTNKESIKTEMDQLSLQTLSMNLNRLYLKFEEQEEKQKQIQKLLQDIKQKLETDQVEKKKLPVVQNCIICQDAAITHSVIPCGHTYACSKCCDGLKECGICRGNVDGVLRIYLC